MQLKEKQALKNKETIHKTFSNWSKGKSSFLSSYMVISL